MQQTSADKTMKTIHPVVQKNRGGLIIWQRERQVPKVSHTFSEEIRSGRSINQFLCGTPLRFRAKTINFTRLEIRETERKKASFPLMPVLRAAFLWETASYAQFFFLSFSVPQISPTQNVGGRSSIFELCKEQQ